MQLIRIATGVSIGVVLVVLCWFYLSKPRPGAKAVAVAVDQVYEAVVPDLVRTTPRPSQVKQLVFDDTVVTGPLDRSGSLPVPASCKQNVLSSLRLHGYNLPFNSLADMIYRLIARAENDFSLRANTIQDFADRSCTGGAVSQTFHTDLPRTFIATDSVYFGEFKPGDKNAKSFGSLFPGAPGIISFSHVGFDASLDEAIVSASLYCGGQCGTGKVYVLKKRGGRWQVVKEWVAWVS
jgi:hypothetical protein